MPRTLACIVLAAVVLVACSGAVESSPTTSDGSAGTATNACTEAGGHCLTHNAPSAKGQGPADCSQFGTWFYGGPLRSSPLSCEGVQAAGGVECCVP